LTLAVATGVARPWITPNGIQSINGIAAGVLFVTNLVEAWNGLLPPAIGHLWSLATEEQFSLLWPSTGYLSPTESLAVAVAASVLCYRLVERPFLRLKDAKRAVVAPSAVPLPTSA
jgi:peptidoglycan/LPS O-acetylase OafA/YrhL